MCDKAHMGMFFDGCVARWAVAHFGQKQAAAPSTAWPYACFASRPSGIACWSLLGVVWVDLVQAGALAPTQHRLQRGCAI
jgi:hypothetical protein